MPPWSQLGSPGRCPSLWPWFASWLVKVGNSAMSCYFLCIKFLGTSWKTLLVLRPQEENEICGGVPLSPPFLYSQHTRARTELACILVFQRETYSSVCVPTFFPKNVQNCLFLIFYSEPALTQLLAERFLKGTAFLHDSVGHIMCFLRPHKPA